MSTLAIIGWLSVAWLVLSTTTALALGAVIRIREEQKPLSLKPATADPEVTPDSLSRRPRISHPNQAAPIPPGQSPPAADTRGPGRG